MMPTKRLSVPIRRTINLLALFDRSADLSVSQVGEIVPPENLGGMSFGSSLATSGSYLAVGAPDSNSFQVKFTSTLKRMVTIQSMEI